MTPRTLQGITLAPGADYAGQWIPRPRWCSWILIHGQAVLTNDAPDPIPVSGADVAGLLSVSVNTRLSCGPICVSLSGADMNLLALRAHHAVQSESITIPAAEGGVPGTRTVTVACIVPLGDLRMTGPDGIPDGSIGGDALADYRIGYSGSLPGLSCGPWTGQIVAMESDTDAPGRLFGVPRVFRSYSVTEAVQRVFGTRLLDVIMSGPSLTGSENLSLRDRRGPLVEYSTLSAISMAAQAPDDPDYHVPAGAGYALVTRATGSSLLNSPAAPLEIQGFAGPWPAGTRVVVATMADVRSDLADMLRSASGAARVLLASGAREASEIRSQAAQEVARLARWEVRPSASGGGLKLRR